MDACAECQIELEKQYHGAIAALPDASASHLAACADCQTYQEQLGAMDQVLRVTLAPTTDERRWQRIAKRARWVAHKPLRELLYSSGLFTATVVFGFWNHSTWLVSGGLLLAVLPDRFAAWKRRRSELPELYENTGDFIAQMRSEIDKQRLHCLTSAFVDVGIATLFLVMTPFLKSPVPPLAVAAIFLGMAFYQVKVHRPRLTRMQAEVAH
ncbi:MAG: hypothetical protein AAF581_02330 [Planctomycetota bacterium]